MGNSWQFMSVSSRRLSEKMCTFAHCYRGFVVETKVTIWADSSKWNQPFLVFLILCLADSNIKK